MRALSILLCVAGVAHGDPLARALSEHGAYDRAVRLADEIGARQAGSPAAERAVKWALAEMKAAGLSNVHTEPVTVDAWGRGADDRVEIVSPYPRRLRALALGGSPGTPGLQGSVVEVTSFEQLRALGDKARGAIVFYDEAMQRSRTFDQYGSVGKQRFTGAIEAAKLGAIGAVVRSVGTGHHRLPHTGATHYEASVPAIPFVAIAAEDAELLHRALAKGPVQLSMKLGCGPRGKVQSANVVGEIRGREKPDEIVLVGAHLDSWDVGDGALDDGSGVGVAIEAARLLDRPRRTVRVVLFMNEENGLSGAKAYGVAHASELGRHVAGLESDAGAGAPYGYTVGGGAANEAMVAAIARPLGALGADKVTAGDHAGSDLSPLADAGVPTVGVQQDESDYFEWHHTDGDTADKIDAGALAKVSAAFAVMVAGLADAPTNLARVPHDVTK